MNKQHILESLGQERSSSSGRWRIADALIYIIKKLDPPNPEINMSADHIADGVGEVDDLGDAEGEDGGELVRVGILKAKDARIKRRNATIIHLRSVIEDLNQSLDEQKEITWSEQLLKEACEMELKNLTAQLADKDRIIEKGRLYQKDQLDGLHKKINDLIIENKELKEELKKR